MSTKTTPEIVDFDAAGLVGGIINEGHKPGGISIYDEIENKTIWISPKTILIEELERKTIQITCFPLYSLLLALGNPIVHYLSLDVKGAEFPILKSIPFEKVDIKVVDVEVYRAGEIFPGSFQNLDRYLRSQGYDLYSTIEKFVGQPTDAIYVKKGFMDEINEL